MWVVWSQTVILPSFRSEGPSRWLHTPTYHYFKDSSQFTIYNILQFDWITKESDDGRIGNNRKEGGRNVSVISFIKKLCLFSQCPIWHRKINVFIVGNKVIQQRHSRDNTMNWWEENRTRHVVGIVIVDKIRKIYI